MIDVPDTYQKVIPFAVPNGSWDHLLYGGELRYQARRSTWIICQVESRLVDA